MHQQLENDSEKVLSSRPEHYFAFERHGLPDYSKMSAQSEISNQL